MFTTIHANGGAGRESETGREGFDGGVGREDSEGGVGRRACPGVKVRVG
jgi:hypothetical protein